MLLTATTSVKFRLIKDCRAPLGMAHYLVWIGIPTLQGILIFQEIVFSELDAGKRTDSRGRFCRSRLINTHLINILSLFRLSCMNIFWLIKIAQYGPVQMIQMIIKYFNSVFLVRQNRGHQDYGSFRRGLAALDKKKLAAAGFGSLELLSLFTTNLFFSFFFPSPSRNLTVDWELWSWGGNTEPVMITSAGKMSKVYLFC